MAPSVGPMHGVCASANTPPERQRRQRAARRGATDCRLTELTLRSPGAIEKPDAQDAHQVESEHDHQESAGDPDRREIEERAKDVERQAQHGEDRPEPEHEGERVG